MGEGANNSSVVLRTTAVLFGLCNEFVRYGANELENVKVFLDTAENQRVFRDLAEQEHGPQSS
jgi:hypothetical protein